MLRITELRKERGMTQVILAENLRMSVKKLAAWEQTRAEPCIDDLKALSDFFEVSIDYLVGRENDTGIVTINTSLSPLQNELVEIINLLSYDLQREVLGFAKGLVRHQN